MNRKRQPKKNLITLIKNKIYDYQNITTIILFFSLTPYHHKISLPHHHIDFKFDIFFKLLICIYNLHHVYNVFDLIETTLMKSSICLKYLILHLLKKKMFLFCLWKIY